MDPGNREVTMLKEPISHLLVLAHCDVIEQPAKTDTLTISDHTSLKGELPRNYVSNSIDSTTCYDFIFDNSFG